MNEEPKEGIRKFPEALKPQREAVPQSPEKLSSIEKTVIAFTSELANFTDMREAIEHAFTAKSSEDANFQTAVVTYFNSLKKSFDEFSERFNREIDYSRELEERIKNADYSKQVLMLEKELQNERAKISLCTEEISSFVKEKMLLVGEKCRELKSADALIKDEIMKFRTEVFKASEENYIGLKNNCENVLREFTENAQQTLSALKKQSINFLDQCEKDNKNLLKKVPAVKKKIGLEQWIIISLGILGILGFLGQFFAG